MLIISARLMAIRNKMHREPINDTTNAQDSTHAAVVAVGCRGRLISGSGKESV
jgi:hypothetical protein